MFDQDEQDISQIVEAGLQAILSGKATLQDILARYPEHAEQIRPELEAAVWLFSRRQEVGPRPGFVSASRKRVLARIREESSSRGTKHALMGIAWPRRLSFQWAAVAVLLIVLLGGTGGMVSFAQQALPGDDLYAIKRASENVTYTVTLRPSSRIRLSAQFATRRLDEVAELIDVGSFAEVAPTLKEFRQHVTQAVDLLEESGSRKDPETLALAVDLKADLARQVEKLEEIQAEAPGPMLGALDEAQDVALMSIEVTENVAEDSVLYSTLTPTPTQTLTVTPTLETPTPALTQTPSPFERMETEYPSLFEDDATVPVYSVDDEEEGITPSTDGSDEELPKPKNTRRPLDPGSQADDRPTKPEKPDKKDK